MKNKINIRLVGIAILAILATMIGSTIIYYNIFQNRVKDDLEICANLLKTVGNFDSELTVSESDILKKDFDGLRITVVDYDGTVIFDNVADVSAMENHLDRPEIEMAFETGAGESVRKSNTVNKNTFYYALLLDNGRVLRVATNASNFWFVFVSSAPIIGIIIVFIILLCVGISHLLTKKLLHPIEEMAENLDNPEYPAPYKELEPFAEKLRTQHADILAVSKARQDFTANVSHELKTPLTAISGYAELLEAGIVNENDRKHFYEEIRKNANRLISIINDIIKLSNLDRKGFDISFEELDLLDVVEECRDSLEVNAKQKNIKLSFEVSSALIHGNREMLRELLENLVQNAIRYNNAGGNVWVKIDKKDRPMLIVKDNGIGISASEQRRVFERFYRVDKSRSKATGGTGLGLAIVKHIVEIHEAKITLDSALGVGTTIIVTF